MDAVVRIRKGLGRGTPHHWQSPVDDSSFESEIPLNVHDGGLRERIEVNDIWLADVPKEV